jgi:hypothetical protein
MHRRRLFLTFSCCIAVVAAIVFAIACAPAGPLRVSARLVNLVPHGTEKEVTAELQSFHRYVASTDSLKIQCRVGAQWSSPRELEDYRQGYLPTGTNTQKLVFSVPAEADACRVSLDYRVIRVGGCRAHAFMNRYGLSSFPRLRSAIASVICKPSALHQAQCEFALQKETSGKLAAAN